MTQKLTKSGYGMVRKLLDGKKAEFAKALQNNINPEHFTRVALTTIQQSPDLMECSQASLYTALMEAAQLSLFCDGLLGQAYIVPYKGKAKLIPGYKGLRELALRTGKYKDIRARVVYHGDIFRVTQGCNEYIEHIPAEFDRGDQRAVYAVAIYHDNTPIPEFMWGADVIKHRNQYSKSWKKSDSMWQTAPERAWEKTVIRRLCGRLELSPAAQRLISREEKMELGLDVDDDIIDVLPDNDLESPETAETGQEGNKPSGVDGLVNTVKKGRKTQDKGDETDLVVEDLKEAIHGKMDELSGNAAIRAEIDKFCTAGLGEPNIALTDKLNLASLDKTKLEKLWNFIKDK